MDHAPFHGNIKIEIPGPPLQYHTTHPISMMQPLPQFSPPPFLSSTTPLQPHDYLLTVLGIPIQRGSAAIIARPVWQEMAYTRYY